MTFLKKISAVSLSALCAMSVASVALAQEEATPPPSAASEKAPKAESAKKPFSYRTARKECTAKDATLKGKALHECIAAKKAESKK